MTSKARKAPQTAAAETAPRPRLSAMQRRISALLEQNSAWTKRDQLHQLPDTTERALHEMAATSRRSTATRLLGAAPLLFSEGLRFSKGWEAAREAYDTARQQDGAILYLAARMGRMSYDSPEGAVIIMTNRHNSVEMDMSISGKYRDDGAYVPTSHTRVIQPSLSVSLEELDELLDEECGTNVKAVKLVAAELASRAFSLECVDHYKPERIDAVEAGRYPWGSYLYEA